MIIDNKDPTNSRVDELAHKVEQQLIILANMPLVNNQHSRKSIHDTFELFHGELLTKKTLMLYVSMFKQIEECGVIIHFPNESCRAYVQDSDETGFHEMIKWLTTSEFNYSLPNIAKHVVINAKFDDE